MRQTAIALGGGLRALSEAERDRFEANVHAWPAIRTIVADWEARLRDGRLPPELDGPCHGRCGCEAV